MPWELIIVAFVGACLGSFVNVLGSRYAAVGARITDRSRCPACHKQLFWWELVPILSFILLRGRCTGCRQKISWQYPIVEVAAALLWVWVFLPFPSSLNSLAAAAASAATLNTLLILFLIDRRLMLLPDLYVIYLSLFVWIRLAVAPPLTTPQSQFIGALCGAGFLLILWFVTGGRGIGFGDIKLMVPLGLLFGLPGTIVLLWIAFVAGGITAVYLLLTHKASLKTAVPFGPFLIAAAMILFLVPSLPQFLFASLTL